MPEIPGRPSLEQYKKQAKNLLRASVQRDPAALERMHRHPRFRNLNPGQLPGQLPRLTLADAQLVLAREHGFPSWPKFAAHLDTLRIIRSLEVPSSQNEIRDPVSLFIEVAVVPRHGWHASGALEHAQLILGRYPHVTTANIYTAAVLADEPAVRNFLARDPKLATVPGGPHQWDALTYLAFSRYLRLDPSRSEAFVSTARLLLEAGASANTGWMETTDDDPPHEFLESVLYAAAGLARHPGLTRLLLEYGADPNDNETCYHAPETYDNTVMRILIESGRCNERSLAWLAARKADWHDEKGLLLALDGGANPNYMTQWSHTPFQHSIRRDNGLIMIEMFLDHGADPYSRNADGRNAFQMAAYHGRADILSALEQRGFAPNFEGPTPDLDQLVAACAQADLTRARTLTAANPDLQLRLLQIGGALLARFAGVGNLEGLRTLLDLGIPPDALWPEGDPYFEMTRNSTALQNAAWRARHEIVRELIARGTPIDATDQRGRTALQLAVKACIDSYWKNRRQPDSVAALLKAGATAEGINLPTGYDAIDALLMNTATNSKLE